MSYSDIGKLHYENFLPNLVGTPKGVMTGFKRIDSVTGGIRQGTLFIVGARPSTGKTSFALNCACNALKSNDGIILLFSLEMSAQMIIERIISIETDIQYSRFTKRDFTESEKAKMETVLQKLVGKLIIIDDVYNAEEIVNIIAEYKPTMAIVDFIQVVGTSKAFESARHRIDYISTAFKRAAKETGAVVMVLSQLTRQGKDAPTMSDLKESGGLEQDGDYILIIHREYVGNKSSSVSPSATELTLDKNKFGKTGQIKLTFDFEHQKFYES